MKHITLLMVALVVSFTGMQAKDGIAFWSKTQGWSFDLNGDGIIEKTFNSGLPEASGITHVFVGDADGDGIFDLCEVGQPEGSLVTWYFFKNDGNCNFEPMKSPTYGVQTDKVLAGDFMGNGNMQIGVRRDNEFGLWWLVHFWGASPDGNFQFGILNTDRLLAGDLNADGKDDIVTFNGGKWKSTFTPASGFPDGVDTNIDNLTFGLAGDIPVIADFDGDGHADMGVYNAADKEIGINLYKSSKPGNQGYGNSAGRGTYDLTYIMPEGITPTDICGIKKAQMPTGIIKNKMTSDNLRVFPNPAKGNETIYISSQTLFDSNYVATISNVWGQIFTLQPGTNGEVQLPDLNAGIYFLKVNNLTTKLIVK